MLKNLETNSTHNIFGNQHHNHLLEKKSLNIYKNEVVTQHYDNAFIRNFPREKLSKWMKDILKSYFDHSPEPLNVFEGGTGTGLFSIPIIKYIANRDMVSSFMGVDNSQKMLDKLYGNPQYQQWKKAANHCGYDRVSTKFGDLEDKHDLPKGPFNLIILCGVLHCLKDVKKSLSDFDNILENNGYLFLVLMSDNYTKVANHATNVSLKDNSGYSDFWNHYYDLREQDDIPIDKNQRFVYDVNMIEQLIEQKFEDRYSMFEKRLTQWESTTTFERMIFSIEKGLTFACGQVAPRFRSKLANKMLEWVEQKKLDLKIEKLNIKHQMELIAWKKKK